MNNPDVYGGRSVSIASVWEMQSSAHRIRDPFLNSRGWDTGEQDLLQNKVISKKNILFLFYSFLGQQPGPILDFAAPPPPVQQCLNGHWCFLWG